MPDDDTEEEEVDKARLHYFKGYLLNLSPKFSKKAFDHLTKAIKLRPNYREAWLELGECYFKNKDYKAAANCFDKTMAQFPNDKEAIRKASIMLRSLPSKEPEADLTKSIDLAKKAVAIDLNDAMSWGVLGNAYLTLIFSTAGSTKRQTLVRTCRSAYQKALLDRVAKTKSDLLFNYGSLRLYEGEFQEALDHCLSALKYEPNWTEAHDRWRTLLNFFTDVSQRTGKIENASGGTVVQPRMNPKKEKKINSLVEGLEEREIRFRRLFQKDSYMCKGRVRRVAQLQDGDNECTLTVAIKSMYHDYSDKLYFVVYYGIDADKDTVALLVYDINGRQGPMPNDIVSVRRPYFKKHQIRCGEKTFNFRMVKVDNPLENLRIDGRPITRDVIVKPTVDIILKND